jgi:hypothetical protein
LSAWRNYQQQAAEFFRSLGLTATIEKAISGTRGIHNIDVYVEDNVMGITFGWIVECKDWKTNVPKEKVAALTAILQDVGADRGFLLSEIGFQSGALRMAEKSNLMLTIIADLARACRQLGDSGAAKSLIHRRSAHWELIDGPLWASG